MPEMIRDYATGKMVALTAEETVRQQFEHILIDELGYPATHIAIEFPIQRGAKRRAEKADIGVFKSHVHDQKTFTWLLKQNRLDVRLTTKYSVMSPPQLPNLRCGSMG